MNELNLTVPFTGEGEKLDRSIGFPSYLQTLTFTQLVLLTGFVYSYTEQGDC